MKRLAIAGLISLAALLGGAALLLQQVKVPAEAIQGSVTRTTSLIDRAWQLPAARTFGRSVSSQSNPSVCGAASLGNVFRSLGDGPTTEGDILSGTNHYWFGICIIGLTLDELARVATMHTPRKVTILRDLTPEAFLTHLRKTNDPSRRYVVNFSRKPIFGRGRAPLADWGLSRGGGPRLCTGREPQVRTLAGRALASVPRHRHTGRRQQTRFASDRIEQCAGALF